MKQQSDFAQQWHADKLLKRAKKKAKKQLVQKGFSRSEASSLVKKTMKRMVKADDKS